MKIITAILTVGAVALAAIGFGGFSAEGASAAKCPKVEVISEISDEVGSGITRFTAAPASDKLTYNWSVSAGTISSGQGTSQIIVQVPSGDTVKAMVIVGGLPKGCQGEAAGEVKAP